MGTIIQYNIVFSYLLELRKLTLIIYNKKIQNKLGIDLEYIKKISGRYQTVKKDGYGKLYKLKENISLLIYKGEYKNGKWNGKGKEYNEQGEKIFEGEYLNGKKFKGILSEYSDNGYLKFEGEYSNENKNGEGKEYEYFDYNKLIEIERKYVVFNKPKYHEIIEKKSIYKRKEYF